MKRVPMRTYIYAIAMVVVLLMLLALRQPALEATNSAYEIPVLFVGILTTIDKYARRSLIRDCYLREIPPMVEVRFVVGSPKNEEEELRIATEQRKHGDIVVLDMEENLDDGKTYHYFKWVAEHTASPFVLKTDDDVYLHLPNMVERIQMLSETYGTSGVYFGRQVPGTGFMAGMGYVLSRDLVDFIAQDAYAASHIVGQEDGLVSSWLRRGDQVTHFVSEDKEVPPAHVAL